MPSSRRDFAYVAAGVMESTCQRNGRRNRDVVSTLDLLRNLRGSIKLTRN